MQIKTSLLYQIIDVLLCQSAVRASSKRTFHSVYKTIVSVFIVSKVKSIEKTCYLLPKILIQKYFVDCIIRTVTWAGSNYDNIIFQHGASVTGTSGVITV